MQMAQESLLFLHQRLHPILLLQSLVEQLTKQTDTSITYFQATEPFQFLVDQSLMSNGW
jgi:hypothetical protein